MVSTLKQIYRNRKKILGMNSRNLEYVRLLNLKKARDLADDKILSKTILKKGGVPVPFLIAKIRSYSELENFDWSKLPNSFVLKPNRGFGGEGIIVLYGRKKGKNDEWIKHNGDSISINDLKNHIRNIIDGSFSISNTPDTAFFEERLKLHKTFKPYTYKGIPDIRVIVYNKVPVMAMLRLPTKDSGGKANLHQGAIGVGIDLATGVTTSAVLGKIRHIDYLPKTRLLLSGLRIPYWNDILDLAVKSQEVSGLGFLGADVAIDRERGPVFLELNARPGLSIQIANLAGLRERLERVQGLKIKTAKKGVRVGMDLFGGEVEEDVEGISGRRVIGSVEKVRFIGKNGKEVEVDAKIDTGAGFTSIDLSLARELGFGDVIEACGKIEMPYDEMKKLSIKEREKIFAEAGVEDTAVIHSSHGSTYRPIIKMSFVMDRIIVPARVTVIDRAKLKYPAIIGKKNLRSFLVDVSK